MNRRGITVGQLLIVILVVVIIVGLILPLVRDAQMKAALTETDNNLKMCALAVHKFHDTYRRLPDAYALGGIYSKQPASLWFHLLPYLDAEVQYTTAATTAVIPAFQAPADFTVGDRAGVVSFAANIRVFGYDALFPQKPNSIHVELSVPDGIVKSNLTIPRIVDGSSNVLMLATRYRDCAGQKTWYAANPHGTTAFGPLPSSGFGGFMGAGTYSTPPTSERDPSAMFQLAPTPPDCIAEKSLFGHSFDGIRLTVAMCDATVRRNSPAMAPRTFALMVGPGARWQNEPFPNEWAQD
jgi:hypothetical protein